jgi:hypothetical protein
MRFSLRASALLAAGSLAVHELRYVAGYGDVPAVGGHGYLAVVAPLVAVALAVACGGWLVRIGRAAAPATRGPLTWFAAATALLAIFVAQEAVESLTAANHPGVLAHGGWIALPLAIVVGGLVALLLCGARVAETAAATAARPWSPLAAATPVAIDFALPSAAVPTVRPRVLARRLAGRAPPAFS